MAIKTEKKYLEILKAKGIPKSQHKMRISQAKIEGNIMPEEVVPEEVVPEEVVPEEVVPEEVVPEEVVPEE
jgi:hypothetical protein